MRLCDGDFDTFHFVEGDLLRVVVQHGGSPEQAEYERTHPHVPDRRTCVGRVALTRSTVHIPDVLDDSEYEWQGSEISGLRTLLGVPVVLDEDLIGVIGIARFEAKPFSAEQIELVETFAEQAAIAIANARLLDAVERQRAELSRFVSKPVADLDHVPRRRAAAGRPSRVHHVPLLRPPRLDELRRDGCTGGALRGPARVPRTRGRSHRHRASLDGDLPATMRLLVPLPTGARCYGRVGVERQRPALADAGTATAGPAGRGATRRAPRGSVSAGISGSP